jgi:L-fuconolactonase
VIDHLGKPPIGTDRLRTWQRDLRSAAAFPNVLAKLSGLNTATTRADWGIEEFLPACEAALEAFGPGRLLCGSDWPVLLLNGDYDRVWNATRLVVESIAGDDADALLGKNAARVYRFTGAPATTTSPARENTWLHP